MSLNPRNLIIEGRTGVKRNTGSTSIRRPSAQGAIVDKYRAFEFIEEAKKDTCRAASSAPLAQDEPVSGRLMIA